MAELRYLLPLGSLERVLFVGAVGRPVLESIERSAGLLTIAQEDEIGKIADCSFHLIWSFSRRFPVASCLREFYRVLVPTGAACVVSGPRCYRDTINRKEQFVKVGFRDSRVYGLSPSLDELRYVVPLVANRLAASALALYQPSLKKAKLRKLLAYVLSCAGLSSLWTPFTCVVGTREGEGGAGVLHDVVRKLFGPGAELALFTGTPGHLRKTTFQVMDRSGKVLGYGKIGTKPRTSGLVEHEHGILRLLSGLNLHPGAVPEVQYFDQLTPDTVLLIQSSCKEHLSSGPLAPKACHTDFLSRLFKQTAANDKFPESACFREVRARIDSLDGRIEPTLHELVQSSFESAAQAIAQHNLPLGLAHRDFTPWNTFHSGGRLFVFDWEFAREGWPPLTDALHFVIQQGVVVHRDKPETLWARLLANSSRERRFINGLARELRIAEHMVLPLLRFYLCDMATFYLNNYLQQEGIDQNGLDLLRCWRSLLANAASIQGVQIP